MTSTITQRFRNRHPVITIMTGIALFLIVVLLIALLNLSSIARYAAIEILQEQGFSSSIDSIDISLLDASIQMKGFELGDDQGAPVKLDDISLRWNWTALNNNHLLVESFRIRGLHVDAEQTADGAMKLAGKIFPVDREESLSDDDDPHPPERAPLLITLKDVTLEDIALCFRRPSNAKDIALDHCLNLDTFRTDLTTTLHGDDDVPPGPTKIASFSTTGLYILDRNHDRKLLHISELAIDDVHSVDLSEIEIASIKLSGFTALQRVAKEDEPGDVIAWDELAIDELHIIPERRIRISSIGLIGLQALVKIEKDGRFEHQQWIPASTGTGTPSEAGHGTGEPISFVIGAIHYESDRPVIFIDESLEEPFEKKIDHLAFDISAIDSLLPEEMTDFSMDARFGKHATIVTRIRMTPLLARPDIEGEMKMSGVDLRSYSIMTKQKIGHAVRSGQLDSTLTLKADKGILDSNLKLTLHKFHLRALNEEESEKLDSDLGFPLNTSLSMLRDRDDRITIEIPITGDISKPDFDPSDALKTATSKAVTSAVLSYYTPFGLVFAAETLFDLATTLRFDPVVFDSGSDKLSDDSIEQIERIGQMLEDRPGIHITLCGISAPSDLKEINRKDELKLTQEHRSTLIALAEKRSAAVKDRMVEAHEIDAGRLVLCEPEIDEGEDNGIVKISM